MTHNGNSDNAATPASNTGDVSPSAIAGPAEQNVPSGDIPDNAIFITYNNAVGGYSLQYIEGWVATEKLQGSVEIRDKDSSESVQVRPLPSTDLTTYARQVDVPGLQGNLTSFAVTSLTTVQLNGNPVVKLSYTSLSDPDPVTGKKRPVTSDRYYLQGAGRLAILTLVTPQGVDNVDAFNQIRDSFRWN